MPMVQISLVEGRDGATKPRLIERVTEAVVESTGAPRETVRVLLYEIPGEHWGIGGVSKGTSD